MEDRGGGGTVAMPWPMAVAMGDRNSVCAGHRKRRQHRQRQRQRRLCNADRGRGRGTGVAVTEEGDHEKNPAGLDTQSLTDNHIAEGGGG